MVGSILIFIVVLSILILVHELGHFVAARRAGIWVEEFGIGIPPRIIGKKIGETIYSINLLPFGGFVRLHGENTEESITKPKSAFLNKNKLTRSKIITAGVLMNFLLGIVAFSVVYSITGVPRESENVSVIEVSENSPAEAAGVMMNDVIRYVGDTKVSSVDQYLDLAASVGEGEVLLRVERENELMDISIMPREEPPEGQGPLGFVITSTETYFPPIWQRPFYGVYYGFKEAFIWGAIVIGALIQIVAQLFSGEIPKGVAGPVGIFALTSQAASFGTLALVSFVGILSVNLAILNIVPFPALDGGRLLFVGIESVFGRKVIPKAEAIIHAVGMAILLLLLLAITFHDVRRLIAAGSISGFLDSVLR